MNESVAAPDLATVADGPPAAAPALLSPAQATARLAAGMSGLVGAATAVAVPGTILPTPDEASRFLAQAGFGATDADITSVQTLGYAGWIDAQFTAPTAQSHWDWLDAKGYDALIYKNSQAGLDSTLWRKLMNSPDILRQRIVLALTELFVVSPSGIPVSWKQFACAAYMDMLEANCFGNFRALLEAVTLSSAMGVFLNMRGNQKEDPRTGRVPDENYAREVMQLLTIGLYQLNLDGTVKTDASGKPIETYDQSSIAGLAKVFTGWDFTSYHADTPDHMRLPMSLIASRHSTSSKSFLGVTVPTGLTGVQELKFALDTIFNHPNVGPFVGKQLIERLVTSNPSTFYVGRVAAAFNDNGSGVRGDMKAVIRAVLLDGEARTVFPSATAGKLREPMIRLVQWARTFKATSPTDAWNIGDTSDPAKKLGQSPLRSPSVFNFFRPGYVPPNTVLAQQQLVAPEFQILNESTVVSYVNYMQTVINTGAGEVASSYADELALAANAGNLVNRYNVLLAGGQLSAAAQSTIQNAISAISGSTDAGKRTRVTAAVLLVMSAPDYLVQK